MPDDVLRDFEKRFNVDIVYDVYPSNEDMFAKLKSGASGYDLVVPSGDYGSGASGENRCGQAWSQNCKLKIPNSKLKNDTRPT
jgi:spermidine/putrescine-binding protein